MRECCMYISLFLPKCASLSISLKCMLLWLVGCPGVLQGCDQALSIKHCYVQTLSGTYENYIIYMILHYKLSELV
jgi:hypothetical protein